VRSNPPSPPPPLTPLPPPLLCRVQKFSSCRRSARDALAGAALARLMSLSRHRRSACTRVRTLACARARTHTHPHTPTHTHTPFSASRVYPASTSSSCWTKPAQSKYAPSPPPAPTNKKFFPTTIPTSLPHARAPASLAHAVRRRAAGAELKERHVVHAQGLISKWQGSGLEACSCVRACAVAASADAAAASAKLT